MAVWRGETVEIEDIEDVPVTNAEALLTADKLSVLLPQDVLVCLILPYAVCVASGDTVDEVESEGLDDELGERVAIDVVEAEFDELGERVAIDVVEAELLT